MSGIGVIAFVIFVLIIIYNLFLNLGNMARIVRFCWQTNTIGSYWELVFKSCFSFNAIFSSIIAFVISFVLFFILLPIILIRSSLYGSTNTKPDEDGALFSYDEDEEIEEGLIFSTNADQVLGLKTDAINASGMQQADVALILEEIISKCEEAQKKVSYEIMHELTLKDNSKAVVPIFLTINFKKYPSYLIYTEFQKIQYDNISATLRDNRYNDCIYFSII